MQKYTITKDNSDGSHEVVWEGTCTLEELREEFEQIIVAQQVIYRASNHTIKWRVIRVFDEQGNQIAQES